MLVKAPKNTQNPVMNASILRTADLLDQCAELAAIDGRNSLLGRSIELLREALNELPRDMSDPRHTEIVDQARSFVWQVIDPWYCEVNERTGHETEGFRSFSREELVIQLEATARLLRSCSETENEGATQAEEQRLPPLHEALLKLLRDEEAWKTDAIERTLRVKGEAYGTRTIQRALQELCGDGMVEKMQRSWNRITVAGKRRIDSSYQ